MGWTSLNSSVAFSSTYSWKARLVASAVVTMNGSSKASDLGKRPGV
jgi:hypothetical protein